MKVQLLGTGASDGIPNVFCSCECCADYRLRFEVRTPTSALIDGTLLIDPGPEAPRQVSRLGGDLIGLEAILAGHAHHDHLDPSLLMHRSWVSTTPLLFAGPQPTVDAAKAWIDPDQTTVTFQVLTAGDEIQLGRHRVEALAANHNAMGEALLYLVSDASSTLLYATDTGPLPASTKEKLAGRQVDLVLLEETFGHLEGKGDQHLNLRTFAETLRDLRQLGALTDKTRVVAIHLGHDNPPLAELQIALRSCGAEALPDGSIIVC